MDDVDAVQAQIARTMLESGDWVTARLNGIAYLEKSPLVYWLMAISFSIFGVQDWAARIPIALSVIVLCWLTNRMGRWAFDARTGFYAGLSLSTCIGLFLFTRILIPDVILTTTIALAMWGFLRALEKEERRPKLWAYTFWAAIGTGLLLKGLIAAVFPIAVACLYLLFTKQLASIPRLRPVAGIVIALSIAAPWHLLATLRNPPYLDLTPTSEAGQYHGFFWFYFLNEHVFRFLNMRHPRDYNTVPRYLFWMFHLLWLFPWSVYLPGIVQLSYKPMDRAGRTRFLALCWIGFVLVFFTFSTTQEYYSMPIYPALALLIGCGMAANNRWTRVGSKILAVLAATSVIAIVIILWHVQGLPTPGDISNALTQNPDVYTLSLGHMGDLTLNSFAYLRLPLVVAGMAFLIGAIGAWRMRFLAIAAMMALFLNAARLALVVFDPYLSSRALGEAVMAAPPGQLIADNQYYTFSSIFFYTNRQALLLNGRVMNLEYGSYAPGAPDVFIDDAEFAELWKSSKRYYVLVEKPSLGRFENLVGKATLFSVKESGGKYLLTNHANLH